MNYIDLLNNFWALNKEYSFTPNEKAVYFALLNKCNELGWKNPFNQSNGYLAMDSGMSESAMQKARNTLQQKGLIEFSSGDGRRINTQYEVKIPKKGSVKGKFKNDLSGTLYGDLSGTLSGTLSGEKGTDNIKHKTKQEKTKQSKSHSADAAMENVKLPFWKAFIECWHQWYQEQFQIPYLYMKKDFAHLKGIYQFLQKRSEIKKFEFTEETLLAAFKFFLKTAWEKDNWLKQNFSLQNLLTQFNQISNGQTIAKNAKQRTGGEVSDIDIATKIARHYSTAG